MPGGVPITLAVEDELSEHVLRTILKQVKRDYIVGTVYGKKGADYLRQKIRAFNTAAKGSAFLVLTDLDAHHCAPALIEEWFHCRLDQYPQHRHSNLVFRVAVREIESWVMADRDRFADFLGISKAFIPDQTDSVDDAKRNSPQNVGIAVCGTTSFRVQGIDERLGRTTTGGLVNSCIHHGEPTLHAHIREVWTKRGEFSLHSTQFTKRRNRDTI
jgi:hypothetical protein